MKKNETIFANNKTVQRRWYLVDAKGKVLGRLATQIANYLRGKNKPTYSPQVDAGDFIVVVNVDKIRVTGKKEKGKTYFTHSGYPAGDKVLTYEDMMVRKPAQVLRLAVQGMLPKNRLNRKIIGKLKIFTGEKHNLSQKLETLAI